MNRGEINRLPLAAARYTDAPFPPYRFIPGRHPHPIANPQGHSYRAPGHVEPPVAFVPSKRWRESREYLFGCDLYNHAFWWEAHEAWEGLWRATPLDTGQRRYLQGIIQMAAIHLQLFQGHADGVARLRMTSREHLMASIELENSPRIMGVDVTNLLARVDDYCETVLVDRASPPWHQPEIFPYLQPSD
ncbi:MAG TPA: DUF309 domain-containing protein [Phycisphaerae bacterium]|nr:DUF309 domain-containing protein [Phycisphaerae bacterium]